MIKPRYISTLELSQFLRVSPVAVFKRIKKGQIKAIKIGRSYAIPESYIKEYFPTFPLTIAEEGEYLSVMEAAQILGISRIAVFKRIKSGKLPAKRVGRHYVIQKDHITKEPTKEFTPISIEQDYVSAVELAQILGVSRITIFNQIKRGEIRAIKVGRHYAIAREDVPVSKELKTEDVAKSEKHSRSVILSEAKDLKGDSSASGLRMTGEKKKDKKKEEYLSLIEAAKELNISRIAVFKRIKKGQIKAIRIGRSYAISREELRSFLIDKNK